MPNTHPLSFSLDVSPVEFAKLMYENTDSNGKLNLHGWYDVEKDDTVSTNGYQCIIKWTKEDVEKIVEEYKLLHKELRTISKNLDKCDEACSAQTNPYIESTNGVLDNEHLEATYFIYVAPFKSAEEQQKELQHQILEQEASLRSIFNKILAPLRPTSTLDALITVLNCSSSLIKGIQKGYNFIKNR